MSGSFLGGQRLVHASVTTALAFFVSACDHGAIPEAPGPRIAVVSGNNQEVRNGSRLREPLVVRATRAGGAPVPGIEVVWQVAQGAGEFHAFPNDQRVESSVSITDADGVARIYFLPSTLGQSVITASATELAPVAARFFANIRPTFEIVFGPIFDCTPFTDPSTFSLNNSPDMVAQVDVPISVGYDKGLNGACTARVKATAVPDGGEPFDTGVLQPGQTFMFTPHVAGRWELTDVINGGTGLLIVR